MGLVQKFRFGNEDGEFDQLGAEFESLRAHDADRLSRYDSYRSENEVGRDDLQASLDPTSDYGQRATTAQPERHRIPLPFGQALTVKHSYRVAGRMPEVIVERREETPAERYRSDTMEKIVWGIFRDSRGEAQFASAAWDGSQIGASCFEIYFSIDKQIPCFRAIDPAGALAVKGVDDPHDFRRFYRFWDVPADSLRADYKGKQFRGEDIPVDDIEGGAISDLVTLVQMTDKERTIRFVNGKKPIPLYERVHNYGFVNYVVIPNLGPERDVWGWADYEFVRGILAYLPKLFSREADILRSVAGGAYQDKRSGQDSAKIQKIIAEGGVLPVRRDGNVEPIQSPEVPAMASDHGDRALLFLKMLGFAPDASWGDGQAGSGSDRGLQMQPMAEITALKQINWCSGLSRLFSMAYRMIEDKQMKKARYRGVAQRGYRSEGFSLTLDPSAPPVTQPNQSYDPYNPSSPQEIQIPQSPAEIFDGDYEVRFSWLNRTDPDDPAYVMSELNKFQQGVQSARTTLEHLGCDNPEDELKLIEQEANDHPWMRQGMIALLKSQLDAASQGDGGGPPVDPGTGIDQALQMMTTKDGQAQDSAAGVAGLNNSGTSSPYSS